jgi:hypothetical protein
LGPVAVLLALVVVFVVSRPADAPGLSVLTCKGARPMNEDPDHTTIDFTEAQGGGSILGLNCVPTDHTVSSTDVDWGDGTRSPVTVTYSVNSEGTTKQAWLRAPYAYPRARCTTRRCPPPYLMKATVTEDQTGERFPLRAFVNVLPGEDGLAVRRFRARAGKLFRGRVATLRAGGQRFRRELSVRISWGDGTVSAGRVVGRGRDFRVIGAHRWRTPGKHILTVESRDSLTGKRARSWYAVPVAPGH